MSGASEEEDIKITADVLKVKEVENTYINSSKERMLDVVKLFEILTSSPDIQFLKSGKL